MKLTTMPLKLLTTNAESWTMPWAEKTKKDVRRLPSTWALPVDLLLLLLSQRTPRPLNLSKSNPKPTCRNPTLTTSPFPLKSSTRAPSSLRTPRATSQEKLVFTKAIKKSLEDTRAREWMTRTPVLTPIALCQNSHYVATCAEQLEIKSIWTLAMKALSVPLPNIYLSNCLHSSRKKNLRELDLRNVLEN